MKYANGVEIRIGDSVVVENWKQAKVVGRFDTQQFTGGLSSDG
jgi:hypothetical protein